MRRRRDRVARTAALGFRGPQPDVSRSGWCLGCLEAFGVLMREFGCVLDRGEELSVLSMSLKISVYVMFLTLSTQYF